MLTEAEAAKILEPFGVRLDSTQVQQLLTYLELLLRWSRRINLTAIRRPEECLTRHFGESFYLARWRELRGRLIDIGSGAGFPGLALKIVCPSLSVTLLEPVAKKRAFLKEVARSCRLDSVEVLGARLEDFIREGATRKFDTATMRAVGNLEGMLPLIARCLTPAGQVCVWTSGAQEGRWSDLFDWSQPIPVPLSHRREIRIGTLKATE